MTQREPQKKEKTPIFLSISFASGSSPTLPPPSATCLGDAITPPATVARRTHASPPAPNHTSTRTSFALSSSHSPSRPSLVPSCTAPARIAPSSRCVVVGHRHRPPRQSRSSFPLSHSLSSLLLVAEMKRSRAKLNVGQHHIPPYERQRLESVRFNEERMKAKGFGSLANKSLLDKTQEILSGWRDDEIFSSDDEYFTSDYEGYDEENETNNDARENTMEVEKEGVKHPLSQPLSMRDFVHKNGQRNQQAKDNTQSENVEQNRQKSVGTAQPAKQQMTKDTARPQKQQPKGKTQEKEYCIPGLYLHSLVSAKAVRKYATHHKHRISYYRWNDT
ncbi:uncharacterized protein LOC104906225 [Beta vulgaris subsp. vulgaris]|uniref:uncharacterized protein LOC104906225 n=1 Tax=Beta vulgaris subsp. vulgaris TaxID=3555 RepID=UPI00254913D4|nr:uncharacterized protein LOC104906225 [Beta vulgaris subsp. vulgaris]